MNDIAHTEVPTKNFEEGANKAFLTLKTSTKYKYIVQWYMN